MVFILPADTFLFHLEQLVIHMYIEGRAAVTLAHLGLPGRQQLPGEIAVLLHKHQQILQAVRIATAGVG